MVLADVTLERRLKLLRIGAKQTCGAREQSVGICLALNQTAKDGTSAHTEEIADEACNQVREPRGVVHVALPPRNRAHVPGIGKEQAEVRLGMCQTGQQPSCRRGKPCARPKDLPPGHRTRTRDDLVLVYVETGASPLAFSY